MNRMVANGCCTEWEQEIVLYLDNEISAEMGLRVEKHLRKCSECSAYYAEVAREERFLAGRIRHAVEADLPGEAFTAQVMRSLPEQPLGWVDQVKQYVAEGGAWLMAPRQRSLAFALTLLICSIGLYFTLYVGQQTQERYLNIQRSGSLFRTTLMEPFYIDNPAGERFGLPDGSVLFATRGTWFSIDSFPDAKTSNANIGEDRRISLKSGEVFIDVEPAKEAFSVVTMNSKTTVFGTQFYVRTDSHQDGYRDTLVAVREGRVIVAKQGRKPMGSTELTDQQMTRVTTLKENTHLQVPCRVEEDLHTRLESIFHSLAKPAGEQNQLIPLVEGLPGMDGFSNRMPSATPAPHPPFLQPPVSP